MDILRIAGATLASLAALFLLTKLMGHKQVSQMTVFDYVTGITIGSIAAEMATELESPWRPLLAMTIYALAAAGISLWTNKSVQARHMIDGKPLILLNNGVLYRESLGEAKLDLDDFLSACRTAGYFDISQIQTALLERNGSISILPVSGFRPLTPADVKIRPPQEQLMTPLVMDGKILEKNLKRSGLDEKWLRRELEKQGGKKPDEVFLALCGSEQQLTVFSMPKKQNGR